MFLKLKFTFFLLFVFAIVNAQAVLQGEVKSGTGGIIPGASVAYLHHQIGSMTDAAGKFSIQKVIGDTLQISSIGYTTSLFSVQENTGFLQATLTEEANVLIEVTVSTKKMKTVSLGYYSAFPLFHHYSAPEVENSVLIPNKKDVEGYISEIRFKLSNVENSPWNLRIRLREVDTATRLPKNDLPIFEGEISAISLNKRSNISIKDKNILLPSTGIFVSLEWISTGQVKDRHTLGPGIAGKRVPERVVYFRYEKNTEWKSSLYSQQNSFYYASPDGNQLFAPNISILVSVYKK